MNHKLRAQHLFLIIAGIAGAVWFFIGYPSQDVRSAVERTFTKNEIEEKANRQLAALGYATENYTITDVSFLGSSNLLDNLQAETGRQQTIDILKADKKQNLKPFYWQVAYAKEGQPPPELSTNQQSDECLSEQICVRFDTKGRFIALLNASSYEPKGQIKQNLIEDAQATAGYYLEQSGWETASLITDSVFTQTVNSDAAINVSYKLAEPLLGQELNIGLLITPAGALLSLKADYNQVDEEQNIFSEPDFIWAFAKQILILLFALAVFVLFFLRMRGRVIDTRPAIAAAVIIGFVVVVYMLLWVLGPRGLLNVPYSFALDIFSLIGMGITAATACVSAFVLFAVSDSVTREYHPKKLACYDYLRQGMVFNRPVGSVILKSAALAFVLAGVWTLLLFIFPNLYFTPDPLFISHHAAWPALRLLTHSAWLSFFIILSVFLVIAGRAYGKQKRRRLSALLAVAACGVIVSPLFSYGPGWLDFFAGALFGLALFLIYAKWDFLTLLLSYFLFLCLIGSTSGWILPDSPDLFVFICVIILFLAVTATGLFAVYFDDGKQTLTDYIPDYVEEHAIEERIKQELQIAREVQQSFLPEKTPSAAGLDIAAVCTPAYETGGDYYDFIRLDENRIAVTIGDVSGKGIQAAFYMTFIKGLLHSLSREMISPAEVLKKANRFFYDNAGKGTFISLIYGVIDIENKTFTFARAGHNPILHVNAADNKVEQLRPNGLGIGLTKEKIFDNKINEIKLSLTENDLLILYTDGITEALNEVHEFYGTDRFIEVIKKHKYESASTLISIINKEVNGYMGTVKQHDDMTAVVIRFDHKNNK